MPCFFKLSQDFNAVFGWLTFSKTLIICVSGPIRKVCAQDALIFLPIYFLGPQTHTGRRSGDLDRQARGMGDRI